MIELQISSTSSTEKNIATMEHMEVFRPGQDNEYMFELKFQFRIEL